MFYKVYFQVTRAPLHDTSVLWTFESKDGLFILNDNVDRGGVLISTWRGDRDTVLSNLTLHKATSADKGNFSCSLGGALAILGQATVMVHILDYELPVAVHSGCGKEMGQSLSVLGLVLLGWRWRVD